MSAALARTAGLSLRLLRLGGRRSWTAAGLVGAGVAVGTMLLAVALGALHGWDEREARTGWRSGDAYPVGQRVAPAEAVAGVLVTADRVPGLPLEVVDLVDPRPGATPPPGLDRMPAPGQVWVSPALAARLGELPAGTLPDAPTGTIGDAGLRAPGELVAIVGRAGPVEDAVALAGFDTASTSSMVIQMYRQLTYVAVVLMVFPVLSLLGASARLTAARRVERLATLRLLGASTGQVTVAAVTEVTAVATAAAVVGVAAQWLLAPALAGIRLADSGWFAADLRPAPLVVAGIVAAVALLATGAAVGGMRQVVVGPLGVVRRTRPGRARLVRILAVVVGVGAFVVADRMRGDAPANVAGLVFGIGVLALFATLSTLGPLVVRLVGTRLVRSARSPARLLAGRRILDDPRGAFRQVAGLTLAVFVAGFLAPLTAVLPDDATGLAGDLTTGAVIVLIATFLVTATSAGTSAAARVLDQRHTLRLLHLAGTPLAVLDAARRAESVRPLLVNGGIALVLGLFCASPFVVPAAALRPASLLLLGGVLVTGVLLVLAASSASRPLLRRSVTAGPAAVPERSADHVS